MESQRSSNYLERWEKLWRKNVAAHLILKGCSVSFYWITHGNPITCHCICTSRSSTLVIDTYEVNWVRFYSTPHSNASSTAPTHSSKGEKWLCFNNLSGLIGPMSSQKMKYVTTFTTTEKIHTLQIIKKLNISKNKKIQIISNTEWHTYVSPLISQGKYRYVSPRKSIL